MKLQLLFVKNTYPVITGKIQNAKDRFRLFKKSLSMNPPANVRANSEKFLKDLGAL